MERPVRRDVGSLSAASGMMRDQSLLGKSCVPAGPRASKQLAVEFEDSEYIGERGFPRMKKQKTVSRGDQADALFGFIGQGMDDAFERDLGD